MRGRSDSLRLRCSKSAKLPQGVPLTLGMAEYVYTRRPQTRFIIALGPTLDLQTLASFADAQQNHFVNVMLGEKVVLRIN
ncbi:hypothetical protein [Umezakia ovalisporum]|uniref:hypothetical protein n=1 Tax=Umezakia ovalisporum TaxID=75695 RepID=UPI0036F3588E